MELVACRSGYTLDISVDQIKLENIKVNNRLSNGASIDEVFTRMILSNYSTQGKLGEPEKLYGSFEIALENQMPSIEIENIEQKTIRLDHKLYPVQMPVGICEDDRHGNKTFFYYNRASYLENTDTKPALQISNTYSYRGQRAATIKFEPVSYDPVSNSITVVTKIKASLVMKKPTVIKSWNSAIFDKIMRLQFKNFDSNFSHSIISDRFNLKEKYLIIANQKFKNNTDLQRLINFRNKSGCDVELVSTTEIGGTKESYRKFIRDKKPTYTVLLGNYNDFPTHTANIKNMKIKSYIYYFTSNTTKPMPDIGHGLLFCNTDDELKNIIDKTIKTENNISLMPKHFVGIGGNTRPIAGETEDQCDRLLNEMYKVYFESEGYEATKIYMLLKPIGGKAKMTAAFNRGARFVNYNGHGGKNGWTGNKYSTSDVNALKNTWYPFVLGCACLTGTFTSPCYAQTWINGKAGGVAYIGAYDISWLGQHILNRGLYRAIMEKKITKFGMAFTNASCYIYDSLSNSCSEEEKKLCVWQYHYFGDPAIECIDNQTTAIFSNAFEVTKNELRAFTYKNKIHCTFNGTLSKKSSLHVFSIKGQNIHSPDQKKQKTLSSQNTHQWQIPLMDNTMKYSNGVYIVSLVDGDRMYHKTIHIVNQ